MSSPTRSEVRAFDTQSVGSDGEGYVSFPDANSGVIPGAYLPVYGPTPEENPQPVPTAPAAPAHNALSVAITTFEARCNIADAVGAVVRMLPGSSTVETATPDCNLPAIGIIVDKSDYTTATVQRYGYVSTLFSGLTPGALYFLGPNGSLVLPPFNDQISFVQQIGQATSSTVLYLQPLGTTYARSLS